MDSRSIFFLALAALVAVAAGLTFVIIQRWRRERRLRVLLDLADSVQALLVQTGERMVAWRGTVGRLAGDLGHGAQRALDGESLVKDAKRDLLQHRLWIQGHGHTASASELTDAHAALERVHVRLTRQLAALESAGDALTQATDAAIEAARREPSALRRSADGDSGQP